MKVLRFITLLFLFSAISLAGYIAIVVFSVQVLKHNVIGNDISFPQCDGTYPEGQSFGVVGVNGGTPTKTNPCLSDQLRWAAGSKGDGFGQPSVQLYVNTANPGQVENAPGWSENNIDPLGNDAPNPYGVCDGSNSMACSWQYGWNRANEVVHQRFMPAAYAAGLNDDPRRYKWWLDIETLNSWQTGSPEALVRNATTLEAMVSYFGSLGVEVGMYSTSHQFGIIAGTPSRESNLNGLDSWLAGGETLEFSKTKCADPPLTPGGRVVMVQYILNNFDYNYSCL